MRELTSHKVNGLNDALKITVLDEPGPGGACHEYAIEFDRTSTPNGLGVERGCCRISFQNGPIAEAGITGVSNESVLAVVEDRLKSFQAGPFACRENALALTHLQEAMHWLHHRTRERMSRGVEGTHVK